MLIRGAALRRAGLFDPRFFMYGEDLDLCLRIRRAGWRVVYAPSVSVLHHKGRSTRKATARMTREFYRSMLLFHDKHFAATSPALVNVGIHSAVRLGYLIALARQALQPPERRAVGSAGP
jgi:GT2 family glycosyltransferase